MKKCLKITIISDAFDENFYENLKSAARGLSLEGTVQKISSGKIVILVCGKKDNVDALLDMIHQGFEGKSHEDIQVEPFLKEKDYRGIFRVLE